MSASIDLYNSFTMAGLSQKFTTDTPDLDHINSIFDGFTATMVLAAACNLELFEELEKKAPISAKALAQQQEWVVDATERLLNACVGLKLVTVSGNQEGKDLFCNTDAGRLFVKSHTYSLRAMVDFIPGFYSSISKLPQEVKTGALKQSSYPEQVTVHKPPKQSDQSEAGTHGNAHDHGGHADKGHGHGHGHGHGGRGNIEDKYRWMNTKLEPIAPTLVTMFDLSPFKSAVDLGGGSGALTFALARAYPDMKVTLFEVPPVIKLVKECFLPKDNLSIDYVAGDFFEVDLPKADLYILSKIIHDWNPDQADQLLQKIYHSLNPGGGLILVEKVMNEQKNGPLSVLLFDMMVMSFCAGRQRSGGEYAALLHKNGFTDTKTAISQDYCPYDLVFARKM